MTKKEMIKKIGELINLNVLDIKIINMMTKTQVEKYLKKITLKSA